MVECIQIVPKWAYYISTEDGQMSGAAVLFLCLLTCFHDLMQSLLAFGPLSVSDKRCQ